MSQPPTENLLASLPRPGRVLKGAMLTVLGIWLAFAIGINWAGADPEVFLLFAGNNEKIYEGQIWRLFTAPLMHMPSGSIGHIITAMLGMYFLGPSVEQKFGPSRMLRFLVFSGVIAYALQMLVVLVLPAETGAKLVPEYWFGSIPVIEAIAIAWALTFKGQTVRLFFILPMTSRGLIIAVVAISVLRLIALSGSVEGLISPFGGMAAGWLLGGGTPSPLRKLYLQFRLAQIERETREGQRERRKRVKESGLRVIEGGKRDDDDSDDRGPDGKWLN